MGSDNDALSILPHEELVRKMAKDLYFGNGKPALTVRIALQEESMLTVEKNIKEIKENQSRSNTLLITTLISSIGGLIMMGLELYKSSGK
jgi:hypothetical protein